MACYQHKGQILPQQKRQQWLLLQWHSQVTHRRVFCLWKVLAAKASLNQLTCDLKGSHPLLKDLSTSKNVQTTWSREDTLLNIKVNLLRQIHIKENTRGLYGIPLPRTRGRGSRSAEWNLPAWGTDSVSFPLLCWARDTASGCTFGSLRRHMFPCTSHQLYLWMK